MVTLRGYVSITNGGDGAALERPERTMTVTLATTTDAGLTTTTIATGLSNDAAMRAAKRAAGRGATFFRMGVSFGYRGPKGAAYIA